MTSPLLAEMAREYWAMEPRALEGFMQAVAGMDPGKARSEGFRQETKWDFKFPATANLASMPSDVPVFTDVDGKIYKLSDIGKVWDGYSVAASSSAGLFDEAPRRSRLSIAEGVGTIGISGVLLKRVPNIARWFGLEATGYSEIQSDLAQAMGDDNVKSIRLKIESPGGQVSGVKETADAIYQGATKKNITAEINDIGASAAYWLASQADTITANPNATVGSLGAYTVYPDYSKAAEMEGVKVHVIASGPHKGVGTPGAPITEDQLAPVRKMIDGIAQGFHADVSRGRGMDKDATQKWMTGEVWRAEEAAQMGVIDGVVNGQVKSSPGVPVAAEGHTEEVAMTTEEKAAAEKNAREAEVKDQRDRVAAITAAFPDDPAFALAQIGKGSTLAVAKAEYADVLAKRNAELVKENAALKAAPVKPAGSPVVPPGGDPSAAQGEDFMVVALQYAKDNDLALVTGRPPSEAMSYVARTRPELFEAWKQKCADKGPAYAERLRKAMSA